MYICSRCVAPDASATACSAAASPACCRSAGIGCLTNGLPQSVMATPQWAIAQLGSAAAILSKASWATSNQKECSIAAARSKSDCTAAAPDDGNDTRHHVSLPQC